MEPSTLQTPHKSVYLFPLITSFLSVSILYTDLSPWGKGLMVSGNMLPLEMAT